MESVNWWEIERWIKDEYEYASGFDGSVRLTDGGAVMGYIVSPQKYALLAKAKEQDEKVHG